MKRAPAVIEFAGFTMYRCAGGENDVGCVGDYFDNKSNYAVLWAGDKATRWAHSDKWAITHELYGEGCFVAAVNVMAGSGEWQWLPVCAAPTIQALEVAVKLLGWGNRL